MKNNSPKCRISPPHLEGCATFYLQTAYIPFITQLYRVAEAKLECVTSWVPSRTAVTLTMTRTGPSQKVPNACTCRKWFTKIRRCYVALHQDYCNFSNTAKLHSAGFDTEEIMLVTDLQLELIHAIIRSSAFTIHTIKELLSQWAMPYGLQTYELTTDRLQFVNRFFAALCLLLALEAMSSTAYYPLHKVDLNPILSALWGRKHVAQRQRYVVNHANTSKPSSQ